MTSVLRRYAQINQSVQFFTLLANCFGFTLNQGSISSPVMTMAEFAAAYNPSMTINYTTNSLLKDLGRQITVYDPNVVGSPHIAIFREVMIVDGSKREGISNRNVYICVWADTPVNGTNSNIRPALVARTGH